MGIFLRSDQSKVTGRHQALLSVDPMIAFAALDPEQLAEGVRMGGVWGAIAVIPTDETPGGTVREGA